MVGRLPDSVWEERRRFVARAEASGVPLATFAKQEGLSWYTLRDWRRRLAEMDGGASIQGEESDPAPVPAFAEIVLRQDPVDRQQPANEQSPAPVLEVSLPGDITIRAYPAASPGLLSAAIKAAVR